MQIMKQLGIILAFCLGGLILEAVLPFSMPASVIGLLLLLAALRTGWLKAGHLGKTADFLSENMAFFFLPAAVSMVGELPRIRPVIGQIMVITIVSMLVTFAVGYGVTRGVQVLMEKGGER